MPGTNPEYLTCMIAILDSYTDRLNVEVAAYKRLQAAVIDHENKSRPPGQQNKIARG
jgi:hypothetical protein